MNELIRKQAKQLMSEKGLTQEKLGEMTDIPRTHISQMLSGTIGKMPQRWTDLAAALGMDIALVPKESGETQPRQKQ